MNHSLNWRNGYIKSHGPATEYDFAGWSGLTVSDSRKALIAIQENFNKAEVDGQTYWFPEPVSDSCTDAGDNYLLPGFDEMICGYKDRSAILESEHQKSAILKNGIIRPVVISENRVAGTWRRSLKKKNVVIETGLFDGITKPFHLIENPGKEYASFLELEAEFQ